MVVAVADGVTCKEERAGKGASLLRDTGAALSSSASVRARIAAAAVATLGGEQGEGCFLCDALIFLGVAVVHSVDRIPRYRRDGSTGGKFLGEMDFDGIYAGDVMYDDADLAAILGSRGLPLRVGEGGGEGGCTGFQAGGEGFGSIVHESKPYTAK